MKIFMPLSEDGYELAQPVDPEDFERIDSQLDGMPRRSVWTPFRMRLVVEDEFGRPFRESDAPWFGSHALVLRPRAIQAMEPLLRVHGELLPLVCEQASIYLFNPTCLLDALDEEGSTVWRFPEDGRIFHVQKYVFREEIIQGFQIFKLKGLAASPTFVTEDFVARWNAAGLRGLTFERCGEG